MVLDFRKVSRGELIAGACGVALMVLMLAVHWYGVRETQLLPGPDAPGGVAEGFPRNAFQSFTFIDVYLLVTALAAIGLPLLRASEMKLASRIPMNLIVGVLGTLAVVLIVIRIIDPPDLASTAGGVGFKVSDIPGAVVIRKIGPWLGLAAALGIAAGGLAGASRKRPG